MMGKQGDMHERMCEEIVQTLLKRPFKVDSIYLSHRCGEIERKNPGRVALYRLKDDSEKKGRVNKVKEPDITVRRDGALLFIEVETDSSPKVAIGDLHCIDASTHICFESGGTPVAFDRCLAMVVLDNFKDGSSKKNQFSNLQDALQFCGSVKGVRICEISEFSESLRDLIGDESARRSKAMKQIAEEVGDEERIRRIGEILEYNFSNEDLLLRALTRRDLAEKLTQKGKTGKEVEHQEALATLGDAVLKAVLTEHLFDSGYEEKGEITDKRIDKEKNEYLARAGAVHDLTQLMKTTPGERKSGADRSEKALATTVEALIGATYRDGNFHESKKATKRLLMIR
ncbi:MAG: ribonuclease III domain-containing protein [Candidatus Thermoplasmatota archaeon]|nr:ribonuclease III domain-containing protein [Candidatus Thermoplasmatota archaeon]